MLPEVKDAHSLATAERRLATVWRTEDEVDLKYSLNLVEEPEMAAVAAFRAKVAQLACFVSYMSGNNFKTGIGMLEGHLDM